LILRSISSSQNSGAPSRSAFGPLNMRISQLPMQASKTDASGPFPGMDESLP
jgi:hypothetical protein